VRLDACHVNYRPRPATVRQFLAADLIDHMHDLGGAREPASRGEKPPVAPCRRSTLPGRKSRSQPPARTAVWLLAQVKFYLLAQINKFKLLNVRFIRRPP
jgi:hypothetical protein